MSPITFSPLPRPITDAGASTRNRSAAGKPRARGEMQTAALAYAAKDYKVLPLEWTRPQGLCSCKDDCASPGAHPIASAVAFTPCGTTDAVIIKQWWMARVNCNLAIALPDDVVVIDLDDEADDTWSLLERLGELPATPEQRTELGTQLWFRLPSGVRVPNGRLGDGVSLRTAPDFVIVPPSSHLRGEYIWQDGKSLLTMQPASLPQPLTDIITSAVRVARATP